MHDLFRTYFERNLELRKKRLPDEFPALIEVGPGRQLGEIIRNGVSKKAHFCYVNYPA
jgi:hypothetical protein